MASNPTTPNGATAATTAQNQPRMREKRRSSTSRAPSGIPHDPRDLDEAAKIDGAGYGRIFWSILLPLSRPALITVAIFSFLAHWSEFITPLIFLNSTENFVLSLGVRHLQTLPTSEPARDHLLMAAATLVTLPPIVVFFALQRYFVRGVVMTGLKG